MNFTRNILFILALTAGAVFAQDAPNDNGNANQAANGTAAVEAKTAMGQESAQAKKLKSLADIIVPAEAKQDYPIKIAIMDFATGAELMLGSKDLHPYIKNFAKLISAEKNQTYSIPLGPSYLGIAIQKKNSDLFSVVPGNRGAGFEDLDDVQAAVTNLGVTQVAFCVLSDIHHDGDANSGTHYGGVEISRTRYSLDLNVIIYDLLQKKNVLAETFTAEIVENRPFNEKNIDRNKFETLLKKVCTIAAQVIVDEAENALPQAEEDEAAEDADDNAAKNANADAQSANATNGAPNKEPQPTAQATQQPRKEFGKLAVVHPNVPNDMAPNSMVSIWETLENLAKEQKVYKVVARSDNTFRNVINEIRFQGTHLIDSKDQKVLPNHIKAVKTLLCSSIGHVGNAWTLSLYLVDAETAEISTEFSCVDVFNSVEALVASLETSVQELFGRRELMDAMLVNPIFPKGVDADGAAFIQELKNASYNKISLFRTTDLKAVMAEMGKEKLDDLLPRDFPRFSRILKARYIVETHFTKFAMTEEVANNGYTANKKNKWASFAADGYVQIFDTKSTKLLTTIKLSPIKVRNAEVNMNVDVFKETYPAETLMKMAADVAPKIADVIAELKLKSDNDDK